MRSAPTAAATTRPRRADTAARWRRGIRPPLVRYNLGTALLRLGRHDEARPHLEAAARARAPRRTPASAPPTTPATRTWRPSPAAACREEQRRERLVRAINHYRGALLLNPATWTPSGTWSWPAAAPRPVRRRRGGGRRRTRVPAAAAARTSRRPLPPAPARSSGGEGAGRPMTPRAGGAHPGRRRGARAAHPAPAAQAGPGPHPRRAGLVAPAADETPPGRRSGRGEGDMAVLARGFIRPCGCADRRDREFLKRMNRRWYMRKIRLRGL